RRAPSKSSASVIADPASLRSRKPTERHGRPRSSRPYSIRSRLRSRSRLRQAWEWQLRLVESWGNSENRGNAVDDAPCHGARIPGGGRKTMRLGRPLRLIINDEEQVFRLVGREDGREGGEVLRVRIAPVDDLLRRAGLGAHEIA